MDPWLERPSGDVHHALVQYGCDQLAAQLPEGLFAVVNGTVLFYESEGHIEIRALGGGEPLVTAIEIASWARKNDPRGRGAYVKNRETYYDARAIVVEIDLLRGGDPLIDVPGEAVAGHVTPYRACVRLAPPAKARIRYYPIPLRERLPRLAIPLRLSDRDAVLDLQPCLARAYEMGRYWLRLNYDVPPQPPLSAEDSAWARERIAAARG
jgi:hypothetical protein